MTLDQHIAALREGYSRWAFSSNPAATPPFLETVLLHLPAVLSACEDMRAALEKIEAGPPNWMDRAALGLQEVHTRDQALEWAASIARDALKGRES